MAFCEDKALTYLNNVGYNVVRLPRSDVKPLDILGQEESQPLERLGALPLVWQSAAPTPEPAAGDTAGISGRSTSAIKLSFGLKILENVLSCMGAAIPQVNGAYSRARSIRFEFREPVILSVDLFAIGRYLAKGDLATDNPVVSRYMLSEDARAYVIYEVLLSQAIRVSALDEHEADAQVHVDLVKEAVGGNIEVTANGSSRGDLTYRGKTPLAFGYKAQEIIYGDTGWNVQRQETSAEGALEFDPARPLAAPVLFKGREFLGPKSRL